MPTPKSVEIMTSCIKKNWYVYDECDYTKGEHMTICMEYGKIYRHASLGWI